MAPMEIGSDSNMSLNKWDWAGP